MKLTVRISRVDVSEIDVGDGSHVRTIPGTWDFDVAIVESDLTLEEASKALGDHTLFELTPVE